MVSNSTPSSKRRRTSSPQRSSSTPPPDPLKALLTGEADDVPASKPASSSKPSVSKPQAAWLPALPPSSASKINITVLLEHANLETIRKTGRGASGVVLLNCDDHTHELRKMGKNANDARPDITHQCLMMLLDSPLNKEGRLRVFVRTKNNVLFEVHKQTRIPRTTRRFGGLMAELLEKMKVRGTAGKEPLLKVIKNPVTSYLKVGTRKIVCTYNSDNVVDMRQHAAKMGALLGNDPDDQQDVNVLYVIGAMAHGKVEEDWADEYICVSEYPLSAATVCSRLVYAYECMLGIM